MKDYLLKHLNENQPCLEYFMKNGQNVGDMQLSKL